MIRLSWFLAFYAWFAQRGLSARFGEEEEESDSTVSNSPKNAHLSADASLMEPEGSPRAHPNAEAHALASVSLAAPAEHPREISMPIATAKFVLWQLPAEANCKEPREQDARAQAEPSECYNNLLDVQAKRFVDWTEDHELLTEGEYVNLGDGVCWGKADLDANNGPPWYNPMTGRWLEKKHFKSMQSVMEHEVWPRFLAGDRFSEKGFESDDDMLSLVQSVFDPQHPNKIPLRKLAEILYVDPEEKKQGELWFDYTRKAERMPCTGTTTAAQILDRLLGVHWTRLDSQDDFKWDSDSHDTFTAKYHMYKDEESSDTKDRNKQSRRQAASDLREFERANVNNSRHPYEYKLSAISQALQKKDAATVDLSGHFVQGSEGSSWYAVKEMSFKSAEAKIGTWPCNDYRLTKDEAKKKADSEGRLGLDSMARSLYRSCSSCRDTVVCALMQADRG